MMRMFSLYFTLIGIRSCIALFSLFYALNFGREIELSLPAFIVQLFLGIVGTVNNLYIGFKFEVLFAKSAKFLRVFPIVYFVVLLLVEWTWGGGFWLPALIVLHGVMLVALFSAMEKESKYAVSPQVAELSMATNA